MAWQLRVVDGAQQGRRFPLPESGLVPIGSSNKHADICLHDLYVARVHAELEIDGQHVVVTAHDTPSGTLVNGQKIRQQAVHHGDVIRVGNSHLRLELTDVAAQEAQAELENLPEVDIEVLPENEADEPLPVEPGDGQDASGTTADKVQSAGATSVKTTARLEDLLGKSLAHFQIEEVIGKGKSGMVFQAMDLKKDQLIALKVISPEFPRQDQEMQRYVQVWKAVMPLRHPNLVSYHGVGKTGPLCWLAMELVESAPMPEMIERLSQKAKIDWHRPYRVAVQIGRALAFAHKNEIVHGNITAEHILWRSGDKTAKLSDLGLAAALDGSALHKAIVRQKMNDELIYLSPEQTYPETFVDGLCDIYSLGVVVYALLTGRFPCLGSTQAETIGKIRNTLPTRPRKLQPDIPKRLEDIVLKMLAKRQEERYQTAEELLEDLQVVGEEEDAAV